MICKGNGCRSQLIGGYLMDQSESVGKKLKEGKKTKTCYGL